MDKYTKKAVFSNLKKYDFIAGEDDFIEVTEWKNGEVFDGVPDEFYPQIRDYEKSLKYGFMSISEHAGKLFDNLYENYDGDLPEKKFYAEWVKKQDKHLQPILFRMYDRKDYSNYIWKLLKPEYKLL